MNYKQILSEIETKNFAPVYFLMGEESYYIDQISNFLAKTVLKKEEQEFNQVVFYGDDSTTDQIINECKQFPFGSTKRLVIVKEGQNLKKIELLDAYINNPQKSTVLVICYKKKSIDKRKKFGKNLVKKCIVFESKKLYENEIYDWIINYMHEKKINIDNNATALISESIGTDLSKLTNELDKLIILIKNNETITAELVEQHIGISKDYNIFELQNALAKRNSLKANKIINYFAANPKNYNIIPVISSLFLFFQKVMIYHFIKHKNIYDISKALKINHYFVKQYQTASNHYNKYQLFNIIKYLKEYDLKSKGINNQNTSNSDLLKELILKILYT